MAMSSAKPRSLLHIEYQERAEAYLRSLPLEHFMEATAQATQREITLESLALVKAGRSDVHVFNELLVQYPFGRDQQIYQVVPDNMLIRWSEPINAGGSYDLPFQPVGPFWVLEYVSKYSKRKDYEESFHKYERHLKVPYLLLFYPDEQELSLYRHNGRKYVSVKPNAQGRYAIPELEMEVALLGGWVRFWFRGELLRLPAELQGKLDEVQRQLVEQKHRADQLQQTVADERQARLEAERRSEEQAQARLEAERRSEEQAQARLAAENEAAQLRRQLEQLRGRPRNDK
jgi:Uma2 family endonuclease